MKVWILTAVLKSCMCVCAVPASPARRMWVGLDQISGCGWNDNALNFEPFSAHVELEMATHTQSGKRTATSISSLVKSFIESEKNSNTIVDILEYLQVG